VRRKFEPPAHDRERPGLRILEGSPRTGYVVHEARLKSEAAAIS